MRLSSDSVGLEQRWYTWVVDL